MSHSPEHIKQQAAAMMPEIMDDLGKLVAHASVAFPGFPPEPVHAMAAETIEMLKRYGFATAELLPIPGGYPAIWAEIPAPPGAPTLLLYGHYDVQPAPAAEQGWKTDPWTLTKGADGRYYGRGAADDKSGIAIIAGSLRIFDGKPPVGIKLCLEGEEETLSHLDEFVEANPERFKADAMIIADMGNLTVGDPALNVALRGDVACTVEIQTIDHALHSGVFGGPAPDALVTLIRLLATLWDDDGNTIVPGLTSFTWDGVQFPEELYREQAGMLPGVDIIGSGSVATKLWSKPNVTVIGLDAPATDHASNILIPKAKARLSMRIAPGADADAELAALMSYLEERVPWHAHAAIEKVKAAPAFQAPEGGPAYTAALEALAEAYGKPAKTAGSGGSIPLLSYLAKASPGAEFILWGAEDVAEARIHGGNESVDPSEIEKMIVAQALLMARLGAGS
jgi:acetylornithine deacetylase/succinyl-diaminopimelate desuccinylase-like protein